MAVTQASGKNRVVTVPTGAEVAVLEFIDTPVRDPQKVSITWEGQTLRMFWTDLQERGTRVRGAGG